MLTTNAHCVPRYLMDSLPEALAANDFLMLNGLQPN